MLGVRVEEFRVHLQRPREVECVDSEDPHPSERRTAIAAYETDGTDVKYGTDGTDGTPVVAPVTPLLMSASATL